MVRSETCLHEGGITHLADAAAMRDAAKLERQRAPLFYCIECGAQVDPHNDGDGSPGHFEHRKRNPQCSLSVPDTARNRAIALRAMAGEPLVTTAQLANLLAGGDNYIRTKDNVVLGLALTLDLNPEAPNVIVFGKGPEIQRRADLFLAQGTPVPVYIKRAVNAWTLVGTYRATNIRRDLPTIEDHRRHRLAKEVGGILFLVPDNEIIVSAVGRGFPDPQTRREVELAAIDAVRSHYIALGYVVHDHQQENRGYDLMAVSRAERILVEVKGTDGSIPRFFISRNERKCSSKKDWRLAVVTKARRQPTIEILTIKQAESKFKFDPLAWECTLNKE